MAWLTSIDTESVSDAGSSNVVLVVTLALIGLGIGLLTVTVWFWRVTRPDPEALGPLVAMSERRFASLGPIEKRRALDGARPVHIPNHVAPVTDEDGRAVDDESGSDSDVVVEVEPILPRESDHAPDIEDAPDGGNDEFDDWSGVDDEITTRRPIDPLL